MSMKRFSKEEAEEKYKGSTFSDYTFIDENLVVIGVGSTIGKKVYIFGPTMIGEKTVIGDNVKIKAGVTIGSSSIVRSGARVKTNRKYLSEADIS